MRIAVIILALAGTAVILVHLRRAEATLRHETQQLGFQQIKLRRTLWDQQITLGYLAAPAEVRRRSEEMSLDLVPKDGAPAKPAGKAELPPPKPKAPSRGRP